MSDALAELKAQTALLATISKQLERLAMNNAPLSPNYRRRLSEYEGFDPSSIGAVAVARDATGIVEMEWNGHRFDRATGEKFNGQFVIFSRPSPEWTQTNRVYYTLVRFADYNDTPLMKDEPEPAETIKPVDLYAPAEPRRQPSQAQPIDPLVELAQGVQDAPGFYSLVNRLAKFKKNIHQLVREIVNEPETTWGEKALRLVAT